MQNDKLLNSSGVNSTDDVFSAMLKEFSSLKAEVLALRKISSHQTTTSHFTYPSHNRCHSIYELRNYSRFKKSADESFTAKEEEITT